MAMPDETFQLYARYLVGGVIIIHGTSSKETTAAHQLGDELKRLGVLNPHWVPVSLKELSAAISKAKQVILLFNSLDNFMKKLRHADQFAIQMNYLRVDTMLVVAKYSVIPDQSPLHNYMCLNVEEEPQKLAEQCMTIFGGMYVYTYKLRGNHLGSRECLLWYTVVFSYMCSTTVSLSNSKQPYLTPQYILHP